MTNAINELSGVLRETSGKGPTHRLRAAGLMPAIVYGGGKGATAVAISPKEATKMLLGPLRRNILIHLNLTDEKGAAKKTKTVMVRDLQVDPIRRNLLHIDFVETSAKEPVAVNVPLVTFGKSKSVTAGGKLDQIRHTIRVKVLPGDIPEKIELDVTDLEFGSTPASAVKLPKGVTLVDAPNTAVVTIKIPRADKDEEAAAGGAPAAAAPAAS
jgi:large subunit ribosomal protein L25